MKPEDLEALVVVYKDLFDPRWRGIEFGCGWGELFADILDRCRGESTPPITITKEKMGSLRIYFADQAHTGGREIRSDAIKRSERICEVCGRPGTTGIISPGFVGTRCLDHRSV